MKSTKSKGYLFALLATLSFSNVYIFSKAALNEIPLILFGVIWCGLGALFSLLFAFRGKRIKQLFHLTRKESGILLLLGGLEILSTVTFFVAINIIPNPAVTSFLGNIFPVMVALGGIFILKERFTSTELIGGSIAILGTFLISYSGGTSLKTLFIAGTGVVLLNALFATTATLIVKTRVSSISPELFNLNRYFWLFLFTSIVFAVERPDILLSGKALFNTAIGVLLEFIAILTVYYSYRYIEASRSSVVQTTKGIFVLAGTYLFFGTLPATNQLFGGFLTIVGLLIMSMAQIRKTQN